MGKTYQEFKDYIVPYLWKKGDQQLIANLDNLIVQGEAKLNRDVIDELRHNSETITVNAERMPLPDDYRSIREVADVSAARPNLGKMRYVHPAELEAMRVAYPARWLPYYSLENKDILFAGNYDDTKDIIVHYNRVIKDFATTDASWFEDAEPDLFLHAVLLQTAPFLREDERIPVWQSYYDTNMLKLEEETMFSKQYGGPFRGLSLPRVASVRHKR